MVKRYVLALSVPALETLSITICATAEHSQALLAQVARVQANVIHWKGKPGIIIIAGDDSQAVKDAGQLYKNFLPAWEVTHLKVLPADYKRPTGNEDAMMVLARLRAAAFSFARIKDPDCVWSLDSDVLPPANALRTMRDMLQFDNGYYAVATCPYPNAFLIGGLGERGNPIYPGVYPDERKIPEKLLARKKELEAQIGSQQSGSNAENELSAINAEIAENLNTYPAVGNVFARNALNGWKPRGWFDDNYPGIGKGAVVPVKWAGFGCNLINREALSYINWDGYSGGGTEDLFVCYDRWEQAGLRLCAISHVLCDHVKVNPGRPEEKIIFSMHHEVSGPMAWHCRSETRPYYQFERVEPRNAKWKGQFLPRIEALPPPIEPKKVLEKAYEIGLLQVRSEIIQFIDWLKDKGIKRVLEIGTDRGGLLFLLLHLGVENVTSIDLENGPYGTGVDTEWRNQTFDKVFPEKIRWLAGNSQDVKIQEAAIGTDYYDLLIIDGDHTKALQDYEVYQQLVREGGWVFVHDIKDTKAHRDQGVTVMDDWKVIRSKGENTTVVEFMDSSEEWGGIGIIQI